MSNLKDLFISQSFYGIINLENSTSPITSQSGDVELQDGIGTNLGLRTNADNKKFTVVNNFQVDGNADFNGDIDISGSFVHTGSIDVIGNVTVNGDISANIATFDTVNTRLLHVTEESASVIFSSGSNVIGDDITDVQEIVGITTISGSLGVTGNQSNTGSLTVSGDISSSTLSGVGNVSDYSSSVESKIQSLIINSGSQALRLNSLELFTSSQELINSGYNTFTQSIDTRFNSYTSSNDIEQTQQNNRLNSLETFTGSLVTDFVSTTDFNTYTQSTDNHLNQLDLFTSSVATTGSNTFDGNQVFSGSVRGEVIPITIASTTASIDCSLGNFFTVTLNSGTNRLEATNIQPGETLSLKVKQPSSGYGQVTASAEIKFPTLTPYTPTNQTNAEDIISFVSYNSTTLYGVAVKQLV